MECIIICLFTPFIYTPSRQTHSPQINANEITPVIANSKIIQNHKFMFLLPEISSYLDVLTCAVRTDPWQCVYSRSGKILDSLDAVVRRKEDELKGKFMLNNKSYLAQL